MNAALTTIATETYEDLTRLARLNDRLEERVILQDGIISGLKSEIKGLQENQEILFSQLAKLKSKKEPEEPKIPDELLKEMSAQGRKQVDFATAARMVKRSKSRMLQLKAAIGQDMRFLLVPAENHSQKMLIRVRK